MISRETWPRASRWSRAALLLLLAAAACAQSSGQSPGQSSGQSDAAAGAPIAVLLTPPTLRRGIDVLPANTIPHWSAEYGLQLEGDERRVQVIYVEQPLVGPRSWDAAVCPLQALRVSPGGVYYYERAGEWSLLLQPGAGEEGPLPVPCVFADRFVSRFLFFRAAASANPQPRGPAPEFPAILTASP